MMSVVYKENIKITSAALEDLIVASGHDLRQVGLPILFKLYTSWAPPTSGVAQLVTMECWQQSHYQWTGRQQNKKRTKAGLKNIYL